MSGKIYLGIDIGKNGAFVAIHPDGTVKTHSIPKIGTQVDYIKADEMLLGLITDSSNIFAQTDVIVGMEDVHSIFGAGAKSNFEFGRSLGFIEGLITSYDLSFHKFSPKTWQKVCFEGIPNMKKPGKTSNDTKAMASLAAQRLYPTLDLRKSERAKVPHDGIVDALLIAHYCKQKYR